MTSQQVAHRTGKPIQADDDQGFSGMDLTQQPGQHGTAAVSTGGMLLPSISLPDCISALNDFSPAAGVRLTR